MLTIEAFAAVRTAELEGFRLDEALDLEGVTAEQWEDEAARWDQLLADPAFPDSPVGRAFDAALAHAAERYGRTIEPLETDLSAWVRFHRWLLAHPRPDAALRRVGLAPRDLARLVRTWSERARADAAIATEQLELHAIAAKSPPTAPPEVVTRPRAPSPRSDASVPRDALDLEQARELLEAGRMRTVAAGVPARAELPEPTVHGLTSGRDESDDESADDDFPAPPNRRAPLPPPLVVPLPRLEDLASVLRPTGPAGPSTAPPEHATARELHAEAPRRPSEIPHRQSELPRAPSDIPRPPSELPRASSEIPRAPSDIPRAPSELPRAPSDIPRAPSEHPRAPSDIPRAPIIAPAARLPAVDLNSTLPDSFVLADMPWAKQKLDALPFQAKAVPRGLPFVAGKSEPPPPAVAAPSVGQGSLPSRGTLMAMPAATGPARATPFQSTEPSGAKSAVRRATPFDRPTAATGSGEPSFSPPTQGAPGPSADASAAAPTGAAAAPPLTVAQLASLLEDLAAAEQARDPVAARRATLTQAGLTEASFDDLARSWRKRAEAEPALFAELARAREGYRRWRAGSR